MIRDKIEIKNGDIIRFNNYKVRDWVAIHHSYIQDTRMLEKYRKNVADHTGYYLFGDLDPECHSSDVGIHDNYGKCGGQLKRGDFANINIVGNIFNFEDQEQYRKTGKIMESSHKYKVGDKIQYRYWNGRENICIGVIKSVFVSTWNKCCYAIPTGQIEEVKRRNGKIVKREIVHMISEDKIINKIE